MVKSSLCKGIHYELSMKKLFLISPLSATILKKRKTGNITNSVESNNSFFDTKPVFGVRDGVFTYEKLIL